MTKVVGKHRAL